MWGSHSTVDGDAMPPAELGDGCAHSRGGRRLISSCFALIKPRTIQIEPDKTYWCNQTKEPGRWPSCQSKTYTRDICDLGPETSHTEAAHHSSPRSGALLGAGRHEERPSR